MRRRQLTLPVDDTILKYNNNNNNNNNNVY